MWSYTYVRDLIDRTVLPADAAVAAGGKVSGYLLFDRDHADKGPATLTNPVFGEKGEAVGEFKFELGAGFPGAAGARRRPSDGRESTARITEEG
jgi:hypothetical protein